MDTRRGRPETIGLLSAKAAAPVLSRRGFASGDVISRWSDIVGDELAAFAVPLEVKFPRQRNDGATLVLQIANGAAATMIQMKAPVLLERVNGFLGYAAVSRIEAHQGPLPQRTKRKTDALAPLSPEAEERVNQKIKNIVSPDVKSALLRLGAALERRAQSAEKMALEKKARPKAR